MPRCSRRVEEEEEMDGASSRDDIVNIEDGLDFPRPRGLHKRSRSRNFLRGHAAGWGSPSQTSPTRNKNKKTKIKVKPSQTNHKHRVLAITTRSHAKDVSIVVRSMNMADIAEVYHLGNSIFTASDFPNLFRTWDDYTVVQNFESAPEFCFVAELTRQRDADDDEKDDSSPTITDGVAKTSSNTKAEVIGFLLGDSLTKRTCGTRGYIQV
jgi:hypothetical protein